MSHNLKSKNKRHRHKIINPVDATSSAHFLEWKKPLAKLDSKLGPVRLFSIFKNDTQPGKSIILSDLDISSECVAVRSHDELDEDGIYTPDSVSEAVVSVNESSAPIEVTSGEFENDSNHKFSKINPFKTKDELETEHKKNFTFPPTTALPQNLIQAEGSKFVKMPDLQIYKDEESNDAVKDKDTQNLKIKGSQINKYTAIMTVASSSQQLTQAQKKEIMDNKISQWLGKEKKIHEETSEKLTNLKNEPKQKESSHKVFFPFNVHREHKIVSFDDGHGMQVTTTNEPVHLHVPTLKDFKDRKEVKKNIHVPDTSSGKPTKAVMSNKNKHELRFNRKPIKLLPEIVQKEKVKPVPANEPVLRPAIISRIDDRVPLELVYKKYIFHTV